MKRLLDLTAATLALVTLAPLIGMVAVMIVVDSPGPIFFRQTRVGLNGRPFKLWKFRTMCVNAAHCGPMLTETDDRRVTRVGRVLRRYKLDELPQLINVVLGDMSLVGPRPELPQLVACYTDKEHEVLGVRPGITGSTQLAWRREEGRYPPGVDVVRYYVAHVMHEKLRTDLAYVAQHSLRGDLGILLRTLLALVLRR